MDSRIVIQIWCNQKPRNNICINEYLIFNKSIFSFGGLLHKQYKLLQVVNKELF